jgi:hypothetical protein
MNDQLEYLPDPWRRVMHTDTPLSRWEYVRSRGTDAKPHDEPNFQLSDHLLKIPGVADIHVHAYALEMGIGRLFTWDEILPLVLETVREIVSPVEACVETAPPIHPRTPVPLICPHCGFRTTVEEP